MQQGYLPEIFLTYRTAGAHEIYSFSISAKTMSSGPSFTEYVKLPDDEIMRHEIRGADIRSICSFSSIVSCGLKPSCCHSMMHDDDASRHREELTHTHADIHEQNMDYLRRCRETGLQAANFYGWTIVRCAADGKMRSIEEIHNEIYGLIAACLEEN